MRKIVLIAVLLLLCTAGRAQVINNKLNLYVGYGTGFFHGKEMTTEGRFTYPSLYASLKNQEVLSFKGVVRQSNFSFGLGFDYASASGWNARSYSDYAGAVVKQYAIAPVVQFHNKFTTTGRDNRLRTVLELAPVLGVAELSLASPLFDVQRESGPVPQQMQSSDLFFGVKGSAGLEYALNEFFGVYATYTLQHNRVSSNLYQDRQFTGSALVAGLILRLKKDKRYFY